MSPLALDEQTFPKVVTILDESLASSAAPFAVHALASDSTIFLSGKDISTYLHALEGETKINVIDFEQLKAEAGAAPAATKEDKAQKEKETAKIEGAVQIAIGVKKEVDFPTWYTNVRPYVFQYRFLKIDTL